MTTLNDLWCHGGVTCGGRDDHLSTYERLESVSSFHLFSSLVLVFSPIKIAIGASPGTVDGGIMSKDQDHGELPSPWPTQRTSQTQFNDLYTDRESSIVQPIPSQGNAQARNPYSPPSTTTTRLPDRTNVPTRAATLKYPDPDRNLFNAAYVSHARSEDLNHSSSSGYQLPSLSGSFPRPSPPFLASAGDSRPSTPGGSVNQKQLSSSGHSDALDGSVTSNFISSNHSDDSYNSVGGKSPPTTASSGSASLAFT